MNYVFDFGWVITYAGPLASGLAVTALLSLAGIVGGAALGLACAWILTWGPKFLRPPVVAFVEFIRNTPFLIQLFFIFFGLPAVGIMIPSVAAAFITIVLALGAYVAEIVRAGIEATPRQQVEAGRSLAMSRWEVFQYVVLAPALSRVWPALTSQFVIVMLGTAVVSQIAVEDLTFVSTFIQSRNFRSFETYAVSLVLYLLLAVVMRIAFDQLGKKLFAWRSSHG